MSKLQIVIPTYNGGQIWRQAAGALRQAVDASGLDARVLVIDSSSTDDSAAITSEYGFELQQIPQAQFDHGGTRNLAAAASAAELILFLTQDAIICGAPDLQAIIEPFADPKIAIAYGRQLPHRHANPIARHARQFNYPAQPRTTGRQDIPALGLRAAFSSNAFAAYRKSVLLELGGFPSRLILSEDMYLAARAVLAGYHISYAANACVRHSHDYSPLQELRRYFDIGVFQAEQAWIKQEFGGAGGEGKRFIVSELRFMARQAPLWLARCCLHNALKIIGFRLGHAYRRLPTGLCKYLSMHKSYW